MHLILPGGGYENIHEHGQYVVNKISKRIASTVLVLELALALVQRQ